MARKNRKRKSHPQPSQSIPTVDTTRGAKKGSAPKSGGHQATRETIESLVIAFVLAFLFRTFQAEAFVIPTGSMAPTLMGRHKDVFCDECGQRYKVNSSSEADSYGKLATSFRGLAGRVSPARLRYEVATVGGVCPSCRHTMAFSPELPPDVRPPGDVDPQDSYSGDRLVVNKFLYEFTDPQRWDVVVFKFPGDATTNYIKRLVGLPEEELRVRGGDVFLRPAGSGDPYTIAQKPPRTMLAMRQLVHDTDRDSATLYEAGWPLRWRWEQPDSGAAAWSVDAQADGRRLTQTYRVEAGGAGEQWLRYEHTPAGADAWDAARINPEAFRPLAAQIEPELITDYNAYNSAMLRYPTNQRGRLEIEPKDLGLHWTGDLMVEAEVEIESDSGELLLDLVEGGQHFRCTIDVATGQAELGIRRFETGEPIAGFAPKAATPVRGAGRHHLRFANFDNQLTLWVDDSVVAFDSDTTTYNAERVFDNPEQILPKSNAADRGDLAPVGVGVANADATFRRLQVWRDLYYIADSSDNPRRGMLRAVTDFPIDPQLRVTADGLRANVVEICRDQRLWPLLEERRTVEFATGKEQLFVMGDNSAESSDCRLWTGGNGPGTGDPGGPFLDQSLLIGKAVCVYWPHAWYTLPFTGKRVPAWPNFADMRLVR